eukprot:COSAG05_NODE_766_length_7469_cov_7.800543_5_plen_88_part_00
MFYTQCADGPFSFQRLIDRPCPQAVCSSQLSRLGSCPPRSLRQGVLPLGACKLPSRSHWDQGGERLANVVSGRVSHLFSSSLSAVVP